MTPNDRHPRKGPPLPPQDGAASDSAPPDAMAQRAEDDFDNLFEGFAAATLAATARPETATRAAHLRLAQENFAALQGARDPARLNDTAPREGLWHGVRKMLQSLTTRGVLTLTTACLAAGPLILSPQGQALLRGPSPRLGDHPPTEGAAKEPAEGAVTRTLSAPAALPDSPAPTALAEAEAPLAGIQPAGTQTAEGARQAAPRMAQPAPAETASPPAAAEAMADSLPPPPVAPSPVAASPVAPTRVAQSPLWSAPATEEFANAPENALQVTADAPVSTFSVDVDTASWSILRQSLNMGLLPPPEAIRIEEMVNYFPYAYAAPAAGDPAPFAAHLALMPTPWNPGTQLLRIGLQGEMPALDPRPALNLVFLIDTSGSMADPAKLPLLQGALRMMLTSLDPTDQVAIVTYAGTAGVALEPTAAEDRETILKALSALQTGGSTAGAAGLAEAYALADAMRGEGEISRVILATDGDFNIGPRDPAELERLIAKARDGGSYLSVLGFGRGNLDDRTMQVLAQNGNGTAAYIDSMAEAQKVLRDQIAGALFPIADDVKVQVEFNPATVAEYRLIGYETRALAREDFNNDRVDAGEIGAGHAVTALYEITPVGSPATLTDPLRYAAPEAAGQSDELAFLRLRWKEPGEGESRLLEIPVGADTPADSEAAFAAAIAGFGQILRGSGWTGDWTIAEARALAAANLGEDPFGYRRDALGLMDIAAALVE